MSRHRPRLGDVFTLATPRGRAFLQYSHETKTDGSLVRVLPGLFADVPADLERLVGGETLFFVFVPVRPALAKSLISHAGWYPIPAHATAFPLFRQHELPASDGAARWSLWDGEKNTDVTTLTPEQQCLPIRAVVMPDLLATRLAEGWTPKDEGASSVGAPPTRGVRHYVYFDDAAAATAAEKRLAAAGATTEVRESDQDGGQWLLVARHHDLSEVEDALAEVVRDLGGRYEGYDRGG